MAWFERSRDPDQQRGFELIGAMIRSRRLALGWTQRDLAARSGVDQAVISRLENGKQYGMRWLRFAELVQALGGLETPAAARQWPLSVASLPIEHEHEREDEDEDEDEDEHEDDDEDERTTTRIIDLALGLDPRHDEPAGPGRGWPATD
jgi:transcriptional regulator with XRE-family HTH domain